MLEHAAKIASLFTGGDRSAINPWKHARMPLQRVGEAMTSKNVCAYSTKNFAVCGFLGLLDKCRKRDVKLQARGQ